MILFIQNNAEAPEVEIEYPVVYAIIPAAITDNRLLTNRITTTLAQDSTIGTSAIPSIITTTLAITSSVTFSKSVPTLF